MLTGRTPGRLALIGVQPEELDDYGGDLRPSIEVRIPAAIEAALELLSDWGIPPVSRREQALPAAERIGPVATARPDATGT